MNWRKLDLNLLVVFDVVMRERSATAAAQRLNMTQPAVSHALARLRQAMDDELFIRTPGGMTPTPAAMRLAAPVRRALEDLGAALDGAGAFNPAQAERTFKLAVNNHAALVIAAPVAAVVAVEAPGVLLDFRPSGTLDIADQLDHGELDCAIGALASPGERFRDIRLNEGRYAAVLRHGHPYEGSDGVISVAALASLPHLAVSSSEDVDFVDAALAVEGRARKVALRAPLLTAAAVLAKSDMIAVMNAQAAQEFTRRAPLRVLELPFELPPLTTALLWHRRLDNVAAHRWLRGVIVRIARSL